MATCVDTFFSKNPVQFDKKIQAFTWKNYRNIRWTIALKSVNLIDLIRVFLTKQFYKTIKNPLQLAACTGKFSQVTESPCSVWPNFWHWSYIFTNLPVKMDNLFLPGVKLQALRELRVVLVLVLLAMWCFYLPGHLTKTFAKQLLSRWEMYKLFINSGQLHFGQNFFAGSPVFFPDFRDLLDFQGLVWAFRVFGQKIQLSFYYYGKT